MERRKGFLVSFAFHYQNKCLGKDGASLLGERVSAGAGSRVDWIPYYIVLCSLQIAPARVQVLS